MHRPGFKNDNYKIIKDRVEALSYAVKKLSNNSILLVLGKGVENYQDVNGTKTPHNDKKIILEVINESKHKNKK